MFLAFNIRFILNELSDLFEYKFHGFITISYPQIVGFTS